MNRLGRVCLGGLLLAGSLLAATPLRADDEARCPWDPLAGAKVGDWAVYSVVTHSMRRTPRKALSLRVARMTAEQVVLELTRSGEDKVEVALPRGAAPTLRALVGAFRLEGVEAPPTGVTSSESKLKALGREVEGANLAFEIAPETSIKLTASKEVKVLGIATLFWDDNIAADGIGWDLKLAGQGSDKAADWGVSYEELARERLATDPLAEAKVGDWAVYERTAQGGKVAANGTRTAPFRVRVTKVDDEEVTLELVGPTSEKRAVSFPRGDKPPLDAIARALEPGVPAGPAAHVERSKGPVRVDGREEAGLQVQFELGDRKDKVTLRLSRSAKVLGVASLSWDGGLAADGPGTTFELAGQGSEGETEWGKTYEQLEAARAAK